MPAADLNTLTKDNDLGWMKRLWADTKRQGGARIQAIHEMTKLFNKRTTWYKDKKPPIQ